MSVEGIWLKSDFSRYLSSGISNENLAQHSSLANHQLAMVKQEMNLVGNIAVGKQGNSVGRNFGEIAVNTPSLTSDIVKEFNIAETIEKGSNGAGGVSTSQHVQQLLHLWKYYTNTKISAIELPVVQNIASEICSLLLKTKSDDALALFLSKIPESFDGENENFIRARIHIALKKKDTKTVKKLLQNNNFNQNERHELIKIWDEALYLDEERRTGKKLTALTRFRVRKRFPPPSTICSDGVRKTSALPRESTTYLKTWLLNHLHDPYPSALEKQQLARMSGLSTRQVKTWFANARRRSKSTDEFKKRCEENVVQQMKITPSLRHVHGSVSLSLPSSSNYENVGEIEPHEYLCNVHLQRYQFHPCFGAHAQYFQ